MNDLERLRFTTRHYHGLQGLRVIPFGIGFLLMAAFQPGLAWFPTHYSYCCWDLALPLFGFLIGIGGFYALKPYYDRAFGFHRPRVTPPPRWAGAAFVAGYFAAEWIQVHFNVPISVRGFFYATFSALLFATSPRLRWYHGVAATAFAAMSILPAFGVGSTNAFFGQFSRLHYLTLGVAIVVCAILDHMLLRTLLPRTAQQEMGVEHAV